MKAPNRFLFTAIFPGLILLPLLLMPVSVQAANNGNGNDSGIANTAIDSALNCPAGVKPMCDPRRVGTTVVLCMQGDEVQGYTSISDYCLSCHASYRPMTFEHPHGIEYPAYRREFRESDLLHESIVLDAGKLICKTCHSGVDAENHFLVENYDSTHICGHCHMTGIDCPSKGADQRSVCYPGQLNDRMRCFTGEDIDFYASTSEFCENCHGNMSGFHAVEIEYPVNDRNFTAVAELDPRIKLQEGRVTCESCHEARNEGMMLCLRCHPK